MTLIPSSFSSVIVPVWFCSWDHLTPRGYRGHAVSHKKTRCVFFKPWGSQFFRIQFKGVRLELLAPICETGKKATSAIFSTGGVPPCFRWGCRQTLHQKLFLPGQTYSVPYQRRRHTCPSRFYHRDGVGMHQG